MARNEINLEYKVGQRTVKIHVTDTIGVEDVYSNHIAAVLHRFVTREDLLVPANREIKNHIILQNLTI